MSSVSDFDIGGVVGVRTVDSGPHELAVLERQLGVAPRPLKRAPDIRLQFTPRVERDSNLRLIGLQDAAFGERTFLLLRDRHASRACLAVPFEQVGRTITLQCERGLSAVPLLVSIVNASMLSKGFLPLPAAAFVHAGRGVLVTGWTKGGKTETLLAFMAHGARFVADERLYLAPGGRSMFGLREPIRLWSWHFASLPELRRRISWVERARLSMLDLAESGMRRAADDGAQRGQAAARTLNRALALVQGGLSVDLPPERLFPSAPRPDGGSEADRRPRPERVLFVVNHERPEIVVEPIDPAEVAERMCFSLAEEEQRLVSCYHKFRFAFPRCRNELLERAPSLRNELLHAALHGRPAFEVRHPYPVSLPALYRALERVC